jgi:8-oxo-dGTP pyrophosphatase MutT (NUDIX family)
MAEPVTERHSDLALVLARVDVDGTPHWLLRRHAKWGDWSLIGGHVEPGEGEDWTLTAVREANEELEPLTCGVDFVIEPLPLDVSSWGPVASRSADGAPTRYRARWFLARFLRDAAECLRRLPLGEFALVPEADIVTANLVSSVARRLLEETRRNMTALPFVGSFHARTVPLPIASLA